MNHSLNHPDSSHSKRRASGAAIPAVDAVVACAMSDELQQFLQTATDVESVLTVGKRPAHTASGEADDPPGSLQQFWLATLEERRLLLVLSGIGLTNAASAAARALTLVQPGIFLLAGTTGGLGERVQVGDIVVGGAAAYADADSTIFGYQPGQIPQMPERFQAGQGELTVAAAVTDANLARTHTGLVLSGNSFVTAQQAPRLRELFPEAAAADMETAAVAQVCDTLEVPWLSVRAVSDLCEPTAESFHLNCDTASRLSFTAVVRALQALPQ